MAIFDIRQNPRIRKIRQKITYSSPGKTIRVQLCWSELHSVGQYSYRTSPIPLEGFWVLWCLSARITHLSASASRVGHYGAIQMLYYYYYIIIIKSHGRISLNFLCMLPKAVSRSVFLWRRCDTLRTSGFVDYVTFYIMTLWLIMCIPERSITSITAKITNLLNGKDQKAVIVGCIPRANSAIYDCLV